MYAEYLAEEELRSRLAGRELSEEEFSMAMAFCAKHNLQSTDEIDKWITKNREEIASGKFSQLEAAQQTVINDLIERFWLSTGLVMRLDARKKGKEHLLDKQREETQSTESSWTGYKHPPSYYPDWNNYNPPSGAKQRGRYLIDGLECEDRSCLSRGRGINEDEAFYLFAKMSFFKRAMNGGLYVCPFCGGNKLKPFSGLDYRTA